MKKTFNNLYSEIVETVVKQINTTKEKAQEIVNKNETWLIDMIEAIGETDINFLAEQITTTDEGKY